LAARRRKQENPTMQARILLALALLAANAAAAERDDCPILPPDSGVTWRQSDGPDFTVCYAMVPGRDTELFGVYTGTASSFDASQLGKAERGSLAGHRIQWYKAPTSGGPVFRREGLMKVRAKGAPDYQAHVWILADDPRELQRAMRVLDQMRFRSP
jgi:hypothetical protein